jgi:hypothetical protein
VAILKGTTMKNPAILSTLTLGLIAAMAAAPAWADSVVYENYGFQTNKGGGYYITKGVQAVADSFSCCAVVDGATFTLWVAWSDIVPTVTSFDWAITTAPFGGTTVASGTVTNPSETPITYLDYVGWEVQISFDPVALGSGTYWFELSNGVASDGGYVAWDFSYGPSSAAYSSGGKTYTAYASETFQILGTAEVCDTPEPSSFLLLGSGLAGLAGLIRRKLAGYSAPE